MSGRRVAALAYLALCAASLPEWSKNATLRPAEALPSAHHHGEPGHVELPVTLLWSDRQQPVMPVAPFMLVVDTEVESFFTLHMQDPTLEV